VTGGGRCGWGGEGEGGGGGGGGRGECTKDLNGSQDIRVEKDFEVPMTELVDYGYIIVCIYRAPDSKFWVFLKNLELIIQKIQSRNKKPLLCGDWNLNYGEQQKIIETTKSVRYDEYSKISDQNYPLH